MPEAELNILLTFGVHGEIFSYTSSARRCIIDYE